MNDNQSSEAIEKQCNSVTDSDWLAANKEALEYCNEMLEELGLFSDEHRVF